MRRVAAALTLLLTGSLIGSSPVRAEDAPAGDSRASSTSGISVGIRTASEQGGDTRGKYEYELFQRDYVQDFVAVSNLRDEPVTVRLLAKDAYSDSSGFQIQPSEEPAENVGSWISLKKSVLRLQPRTETVLPFQLGVPYNATPGDHAGAIVVSLLAEEAKPEGGTIVVDHRVAMRVYLRVPGTLEPEIAIEDLKLTYEGGWTSALGFGRPTVSYVVHNTGNVRLNADQLVELQRSLGLSEATHEPVGIEDLLPAGRVSVTHTFDRTWAVGSLSAIVSLRPEALDASITDLVVVTDEASVVVIPWLLLVLVLLAVVAGVGGWRWRSKRRAARPARGRRIAEQREPALLARVRAVRAVAVGACCLALVGLVLTDASPAQAADEPVWQLKVQPRSGTADTPIDLITSGGCPEPATNIIGRLYGAGLPREGYNVIGNTDAEVTSYQPIYTSSENNIKATLAEAGAAAPQGTYRFEILCVTAPGIDSYGRYVADIRFTDAQRWVAAPPVTTDTGPTAELDQFGDPIEQPSTSEEPGKNGKGGTQGGPGRSPGDSPGEAGSPGAAGSDDPALAADDVDPAGPLLTPAADSEDSQLNWLLIGGGLAVLGATVFLFWRRPS